MQVSIIFESTPDNNYDKTLPLAELHKANDQKVAAHIAALSDNERMTVGAVSVSGKGIHDAIIDSTTLNREAVKAAGLLKGIQAHPSAPPMDLLAIRPDVTGVITALPPATEKNACTIDIPWSAVLGASILHGGQHVRVAFQMNAALSAAFAVCVESSPQVKTRPADVSKLYTKQFITFNFQSTDEAFVFAEVVNKRHS